MNPTRDAPASPEPHKPVNPISKSGPGGEEKGLSGLVDVSAPSGNGAAVRSATDPSDPRSKKGPGPEERRRSKTVSAGSGPPVLTSETGPGGTINESENATGSEPGLGWSASAARTDTTGAVMEPWRLSKPWSVIPAKRKSVKRMMFESMFGKRRSTTSNVFPSPS